MEGRTTLLSVRPLSGPGWRGERLRRGRGLGAGRGQRARGWWICTRWGSRATGSEGGSQLRFARCPLSPPRARLLHTAGAAHHDALAAPAPGPPSLAPERPRWVSFGFQSGRFSRQLSGAAIRARGDAAGSVRGRRCSAEATGEDDGWRWRQGVTEESGHTQPRAETGQPSRPCSLIRNVQAQNWECA